MDRLRRFLSGWIGALLAFAAIMAVTMAFPADRYFWLRLILDAPVFAIAAWVIWAREK